MSSALMAANKLHGWVGNAASSQKRTSNTPAGLDGLDADEKAPRVAGQGVWPVWFPRIVRRHTGFDGGRTEKNAPASVFLANPR